MSYSITRESFDALASYRADPSLPLNWSSIFILPVWMKTWWQVFGAGRELCLATARNGDSITGIAPLMIKDGSAALIGSADVCDYLDFIVAPGQEKGFFSALLDYLRQNGVNFLELATLRPDSAALNYLEGVAREHGCSVDRQQEDVSVEMELPSTWDEYLDSLSTKQRHEVRRKLRRLFEAGDIRYEETRDRAALNGRFDIFLKMFAESRADKTAFLTPPREQFFRSLADAMAGEGMLRLGTLEVDTLPSAMILSFAFQGCLYLYNSGFDRHFDHLSAGLLSKVLSIRTSIEEGMKKYDFLKGNETYKYRLGGREIPVYRCRIGMGNS